MTSGEYTVFDTALGRCAIGWQDGRVTATALPGAEDRALAATVRRLCPGSVAGEPTAAIVAAIEAIRALLDGEPRDLSGIAVDLGDAEPFAQDVYRVARTIAPGETLTYGAVAAHLGAPAAARAVGAALGRNPVPIIVPCHRVLAASGRTGGFSAPGGVGTKMRLLSIEARHAPRIGLFDVLPLQAKSARARGARA